MKLCAIKLKINTNYIYNRNCFVLIVRKPLISWCLYISDDQERIKADKKKDCCRPCCLYNYTPVHPTCLYISWPFFLSRNQYSCWENYFYCHHGKFCVVHPGLMVPLKYRCVNLTALSAYFSWPFIKVLVSVRRAIVNITASLIVSAVKKKHKPNHS